MKDIPTAPPLPNTPPAQDFSKLGFVYITALGLANQVVPYTGSWRPLATSLNYLVCIAPIVYMAFQAWPASPVGVQSDSSMDCGSSTFPPRNLTDHKLLQYFNMHSHLTHRQAGWVKRLSPYQLRIKYKPLKSLLQQMPYQGSTWHPSLGTTAWTHISHCFISALR
ncbi:hypothetical protein DSO57_1001240 [Entomophthora muscae]|uniref:Uncharacterized protein n=1 Tax=Entomophthora muscae TaxID=34485 RepID=A0ACC2SM28_9FUNG|nr:hypothetical protein DSO57_1001240 [Entomophthora muscae]